jgi:hypothetical protein
MKTPECVKFDQLRRIEGDVLAHMNTLFRRCPDLAGFALENWSGLPSELFISEIDFSIPVSNDRYAETYKLVQTAVAQVLSEQPEAFEVLRSRTFARIFH